MTKGGDSVQLRDDDVKTLENGMMLDALTSASKTDQRFYRLDLVNNQLVETTQGIMKKEKYYSFFNMIGVKIGCNSNNLKQYKLKKCQKDQNKASELENKAFVLIYDDSSESIDLLAPTQVDRDRWLRVLDYFILQCKRKGALPEAGSKEKRNMFELADKSKDKTINTKEITTFLESINLNIKKDQLGALIQGTDENNDGKLDEKEFQEFMASLSKRPEIESLFQQLTTTGKSPSKSKQEYMKLQTFQRFLSSYQLEETTEEECKEIIMKYEPSDCKYENKLTVAGFSNYLNDVNQHIMDPKLYHSVYHDMDQPLQNYFINSSHNTYLSGDQYKSASKVDCYISVLLKGCRLLELDCHDGPSGPQVFHNYTLTSKLEFEDIIIAVKEFAFKASDYPVILTLENHCSPPQQKQMAQCIQQHLNEYLYKAPVESYQDQLPKLSTLKRKIFIRSALKEGVRKGVMNEAIEAINKNEIGKMALNTINIPQLELKHFEDEQNEEFKKGKYWHFCCFFSWTPEQAKKNQSDDALLTHLINVFQNVSFKGLYSALESNKPYQGSSLSEVKANKLIENDICGTINFSNRFLIKTYPAGWRLDSSNYDPVSYWNCGFQMVALNFQKGDLAISLNEALFNDNGQCGYILKPKILRDMSLGFNPFDVATMQKRKILEIKVISGQSLPAPSNAEIIKDIIDPYVVISTHGVFADRISKRTKTVANNGFNPIWNETFEFQVNCPELAFVKFTVTDDDDLSQDDIVGEYTIRFENMRQGYRHIKLKNKTHTGSIFVAVRIKPL